MNPTQPPPPTSRRIERRHNPRLREVYPSACQLLAEKLGHHGNAHQPRRQHLASHLLAEAFPQLTPAELDILCLAVLRALDARSGA